MAHEKHIKTEYYLKLKCKQHINILKSSVDKYIEISHAELEDKVVIPHHQSESSIADLYGASKELKNHANEMQATIDNLQMIERDLEFELQETLKENVKLSTVLKSIISTYNKAFDFQHQILNCNNNNYTLRIMFAFNGKLYANYYIDFIFDYDENLLDFHANLSCLDVENLKKWYSENKNVIQLICKLRNLLKDYIVMHNL